MTADATPATALRAALDRKEEALRQLRDHRNFAHDLATRETDAREQEQRLEEAEDRDAALRLVDGPEAAPPNPGRRKTLANLKIELKGFSRALA